MSQVNGTVVPLDRFTSLLGEDVFFVPCEWGTKEPLLTYVERPFEGTKTPAYRAVFDATETNIAVYLGKSSGGLCAIDCDADDNWQLSWRRKLPEGLLPNDPPTGVEVRPEISHITLSPDRKTLIVTESLAGDVAA